MSLRKTELIAIFNITPDSFSEDSGSIDNFKILEKIQKLLETGAKIIEIGAESTRPNATKVSIEEEWKRLEPILEQIPKLHSKHQFRLSLDSRNEENIRKAINMGVMIDIVNDQSAFEDEKMLKLMAETQRNIVLMHNLGIPADKKKIIPENKNVIEEIFNWAEKKIKILEKVLINRKQIIFDPGIGFGKNAKQNWQILEEIERFQDLGAQIMVGHSRKSFLEIVNDGVPKKRDFETAIITAHLIGKVDYIRVHNFSKNNQVLNVIRQCVG